MKLDNVREKLRWLGVDLERSPGNLVSGPFSSHYVARFPHGQILFWPERGHIAYKCGSPTLHHCGNLGMALRRTFWGTTCPYSVWLPGLRMGFAKRTLRPEVHVEVKSLYVVATADPEAVILFMAFLRDRSKANRAILADRLMEVLSPWAAEQISIVREKFEEESVP